jgi:hypothetical protein
MKKECWNDGMKAGQEERTEGRKQSSEESK